MKYYYKIKGNKTIFSPSLLGGKSSQIGTAIDSEERDTRTVPPSYINPEWPKLYSNVNSSVYGLMPHRNTPTQNPMHKWQWNRRPKPPQDLHSGRILLKMCP